jgi:hypothetical protein
MAIRTIATGRWSQFEAIGLGAKVQPVRTRSATLALAGYRFLGFAILAVIVIVLIGYVATTLFYMVNRSWIVPTVISPSDEKVLALQTELSLRQTQRERVLAELNAAEHAVAAEERFQRELATTIHADLATRQAELARMRSLATSAATTRRAVRTSSRAFAAAQSAQLAREDRAGVVDRSSVVTSSYQLAQISSSSLSLAERQADFDTRADELEAAVTGLAAIVDEHADETALSYNVLTIKRGYDASKLALAKARDTRAMLASSVKRLDHLIANLAHSGYLRAVRDRAAIAAVPYENLSNVRAGASLHACRASLLLCRRVGRVLEVLPGEVTVRHPHRDRTQRGRMIVLRLDEPAAARNEVLFVGGAPLWL